MMLKNVDGNRANPVGRLSNQGASSSNTVRQLDVRSASIHSKLTESNLPHDHLPHIADKHASLFYRAANNGARPTQARMTNYVNTVLALKEHVANNSEKPNAAAMQQVLEKHENLFSSINHLLGLEHKQVNLELTVGAQLIEDSVKDGLKDIVSSMMGYKTEYRDILNLKNAGEASLETTLDNVAKDSSLPCLSLPPIILLEFVKDESNVDDFVLKIVKMVLSVNASLDLFAKSKNEVAREVISDNIAKLINFVTENKREISILVEQAHELKREIPDLVARELKEEISKKIDEGYSDLNMLKLSLQEQKPPPIDKLELLQRYEDAIKVPPDPGIDVISRVVNKWRDINEKSAIFEDIKNELEDHLNEKRAISKSRPKKGRSKGVTNDGSQASLNLSSTRSNSPTNTGVKKDNFSRMSFYVKQNLVAVTDIDASILKLDQAENATKAKAAQVAKDQLNQEIQGSWLKGTFDDVRQSIKYHQNKHAPADDIVSYVKESREFLAKTLRDFPLSNIEKERGVISRHTLNGDFIKASFNESDNKWKVYTFHSHRYTIQENEIDGEAKLKPGESPALSVEKPASSVERRLRSMSIG